MTKLIRRDSARILLADEHDHILLFNDSAADGKWFTPGGGIDPGERPAEAAVRELEEETGLKTSVKEIGPVVATSTGYWRGGWDGKMRWAVDSYFFLRTESFVPDTSGFTAYERDFISEHRWWPLTELIAQQQAVVPWGVQDLLPRLFAGELPDRPVELPWHHPEFADLTPPS